MHIYIGKNAFGFVKNRDQVFKRVANGEHYLEINLDDYQVYDPIHQDMFQQMPGQYLAAVACMFLKLRNSLRMLQNA